MSEYESFWIGFGDIHGDVTNVNRIPGLSEADGVIISGDLTTRGGLDEARRILETVQAKNAKVYAQIGNMDTPRVDEFLEREGVNIHTRGLNMEAGVALMGVGASSPTPFGTPSEFPDEQLGQWLESAYAMVEGAEHLLLVAHDPPKSTKADVVGGGSHVGSEAVRNFIERVQPEVCLTGHIHESRAQDKLGKTLIVNPGMLSQGGYAVIGLRGGKLTAELRTI